LAPLPGTKVKISLGKTTKKAQISWARKFETRLVVDIALATSRVNSFQKF
jgi:hypothetical protein